MAIKFHIPDFLNNYRVNIAVIDKLITEPEYFIDGLIIESAFGAFPSDLWNGGRLFLGHPIKEIDKIIEDYNSRGVALSFTYTNPLIDKEHLADPFCNRVLKTAENGLNQVTVFSSVLEQYIRDTYPKYPLVSSTCKRITDIDKLNEELSKDYKYVVLDYDWNNNQDIFPLLTHKEKCTMLVDPWCHGKCKHRLDHYYLLGKTQIEAHAEFTEGRIPMKRSDVFSICPSLEKGPIHFYDKTKLDVHISNTAIQDVYVPNSITSFKIEGRKYIMYNILEAYMYYLVKPEFRDLVRLEILLKLFHRQV